MRAVIALNKIKLKNADYKQLADDFNIPQGRIRSVVKMMHPHVNTENVIFNTFTDFNFFLN